MKQSSWMQDFVGKCRYPIGDISPFIPCCRPVLRDKVYCADHYGQCYTGVYKAIKRIRGETPTIKQIASRGAHTVSN